MLVLTNWNNLRTKGKRRIYVSLNLSSTCMVTLMILDCSGIARREWWFGIWCVASKSLRMRISGIFAVNIVSFVTSFFCFIYIEILLCSWNGLILSFSWILVKNLTFFFNKFIFFILFWIFFYLPFKLIYFLSLLGCCIILSFFRNLSRFWLGFIDTLKKFTSIFRLIIWSYWNSLFWEVSKLMFEKHATASCSLHFIHNV